MGRRGLGVEEPGLSGFHRSESSVEAADRAASLFRLLRQLAADSLKRVANGAGTGGVELVTKVDFLTLLVGQELG